MDNIDEVIEKITLTPDDVKNLLADNSASPVLVDVREEFELRTGIIAGAVHYPTSTFLSYLDKFNTSDNYIIYCAHGVRSENIALYLIQKGIRAFTMQGGIADWTGELVPFRS